ncbi:MAG: DUF5667 domain-containing protein [bacterium]|nr:DUF5667 domain-containing protein [bacterium]
MKKVSLLICSLVLLGIGGLALAQDNVLPAKEPLPELPNPGLKPGDFFYFFDEWTEAIEDFFIFNPEAKALLQTERALERIAEIKALLEIKGIDAPGLDVAQKKIQTNMARAAQILAGQKAKGKEISQLAERLDDEFDARQELLKQTFKVEKKRLELQKEEIKLQIIEARLAGDFERIEQLRVSLAAIEVQKETLEQKWEAQEELLELEEEKLEAELEAEEKELEELEEEEEDLFERKEKEIENVFKQKERALELQEKALEVQLKQAISAGDTELAGQIRTQLQDLETEKEVLEAEEEAAEEALEEEEGENEEGENEENEEAEGENEEED